MIIAVLLPVRFTSARASTFNGIDFVGIFGAPLFGFDMSGPYVAGFNVGAWGRPV
ncbi:hypothetical protein [Burkholderia sp. F1]|uniref:hypothetical protein n=1 Tax=Burkholderia sp. F1 TaxID=3366817 RepID=UPI003D70A1A0